MPENPLDTMAIDLTDIPYDNSDRLESTRLWLNQHPEVHSPYRKVISDAGKSLWFDKDHKPVARDVHREKSRIQEYLDNLKSHDPKHYEQLDNLRQKIAPMGVKTRVAVNIPAWMEGKIIYHTLELYSHQTDKQGQDLDPELYEINVIVNRKLGDPADNSVSEIERFKEDLKNQGRNIQINYIDIEFPEPFNNVGNARRVITDLTLLRSVYRDHQDKPLYIESEDADLMRVDPRTIINVIEKLDENPYLDAVRGRQDRMPEIMMDNDLLFLYRRFQDIYEILARRHSYRPEVNPKANFNWNRVVTGGWNTAYTAEAYALTLGYDPTMTKDEDMILGERISMVRGDGSLPNTHVIGTVSSRSDSSPRRYINEVATVKPAYGGSFEDINVNKKIRDVPEGEFMLEISPYARIDDDNVWRFQAMLNEEYWWIKQTTPSLEEAHKFISLEMLMLGFKKEDYKLNESDEIIVENWKNVKQALETYREKHRKTKTSLG